MQQPYVHETLFRIKHIGAGRRKTLRHLTVQDARKPGIANMEVEKSCKVEMLTEYTPQDVQQPLIHTHKHTFTTHTLQKKSTKYWKQQRSSVVGSRCVVT